METVDIQLSPAACDPVYKPTRRLFQNIRYLEKVLFENSKDLVEPQDIGIETFSGDTTEGGMPDD